jgi:hypothetical protein
MVVEDKQGYVRMLALRAMTLSETAIAKELRPNSSASLSNRKKLPWCLRLPANMCGIGYALSTNCRNDLGNYAVDRNSFVDKWVVGLMLEFDIQDPAIKHLSLHKIRSNVARVTKSALETWSPAISGLTTSITPKDSSRVHVGTMAVVKSPDFRQVGDEVFSHTMKGKHGRMEEAADPCNRIYMVLWELFNRYPAYLLLGRM